jgi:hypothetical protein
MPPTPTDRTAVRLVWASFALGLVLSAILVARSQVAGDQLNLLARGWLLLSEGRWISYGNPMSTGGKTPGGLTSLLVGLPFFLWRDHRAATLVVLAFHILAWLILDGTLKRRLSPRERLLFAVLYWLNPWRLYFSGFLWNPNYLFLFGALHLWSCLAQRDRARFWPSFVLGAALVVAFQIHASVVLLVAASALLWLRGYFKPHWLGGIAGAALAALPLIPFVLDLQKNPVLVTEADKGFVGRGLLLVFPLLRGLSYWLRYASLHLPGKAARFDFSGLLGSDLWLGPGLTWISQVPLALTVLIPIAANVWMWRRNRHRVRRRFPPEASDRVWLHGYVVWCFAAAVIVYCLAPTTVMYWQAVLLFHACVLPLVFWAGALWRSRHAFRITRGVTLWATLGVLLTLALAFGGPQYRCGGRDDLHFPLASHSPMFEELHIQQTCPWPLDQPVTWWPDVLPKGGG